MSNQSSSTLKENKMGTMPINKLLITMSLPMMVSMLVQALYNIIDSIFVAMISENAFTAVNYAFPAQNLLIGVAVGTGVGMSSLLSRYLGAKEFDSANKSAVNGMFLYLLSYSVFLLLGIFAVRPFFEVQTENAEVVRYGCEYLSICMIGSIFSFGEICFNRLLQSTGRTTLSMFVQMTGAIVNIILDPVFIFVFDMGIAGAAIATVIGQAAGTAVGIFANLKLNKDIHISFKGFKPDGKIIKNIYSVGLPSILMQSVGSVMVFFMNSILSSFTEVATNVFGAYFKIQSFFFMPVFGLNNGMVPIVAYNFGARRRKRITKTIKLAVIYAIIIMSLGTLFMVAFPELLLSMFSASDEMLKIGAPALRIIASSFLGAAVCICLNSVSQAVGNGMYSFIVSFARQLIFLLPIAYLMSLTGNLDLVWVSYPIAEIASLILSAFLYKRIYDKKLKTMDD
ncbi:MAG: MATE family efflux transporter [Clostridia bacterium]|nr:MATE family efflux transporter [Clostridia bacterium]